MASLPQSGPLHRASTTLPYVMLSASPAAATPTPLRAYSHRERHRTRFPRPVPRPPISPALPSHPWPQPAPDSHHCPRSHPDPHSCAPGPVVEPRPAHVRPGVRGSDGRTPAPAPARPLAFLPSFLSTPPRRASSIHSGLRASPPLFVFVFVFCSFSFSGRACAVRARSSSVAGPGAPDGGRVGIWKP